MVARGRVNHGETCTAELRRSQQRELILLSARLHEASFSCHFYTFLWSTDSLDVWVHPLIQKGSKKNCVSFPVARPKMLCILAGMDQKDSSIRALVVIPGSGMCKAGFTGDFEPRVVSLSFLLSGPDARYHCGMDQTDSYVDGPDCIKLRKFRSCSSLRSSTFPSRRRGRFPRSCRTTEFPPVACGYGGRCPCLQVVQILLWCLVWTVEIPQCSSSSSLSWRRCRSPWPVLPQRFSSCSTLIRWSTFVVQSCSPRVQMWRRQPSSHRCTSMNSGQVVACPLCATAGAVWSMTWRRSPMVFDIPVIMQRREL